MAKELDARIKRALMRGAVIPAHTLALTAERRLDERRQRALTRYYIAAGAGGLAVGVVTRQIAVGKCRRMGTCSSLFLNWPPRKRTVLIVPAPSRHLDRRRLRGNAASRARRPNY